MKTSELTGAALDWAVAKCEKLDAYIDIVGITDNGWGVFVDYSDDYCNVHYQPSKHWGWAGPIIEREKIGLWFSEDAVDEEGNPLRKSEWYAELCSGYTGDTPLEAAMRAYVDTRLGDEVDIPKELL